MVSLGPVFFEAWFMMGLLTKAAAVATPDFLIKERLSMFSMIFETFILK